MNITKQQLKEETVERNRDCVFDISTKLLEDTTEYDVCFHDLEIVIRFHKVIQYNIKHDTSINLKIENRVYEYSVRIEQSLSTIYFGYDKKILISELEKSINEAIKNI